MRALGKEKARRNLAGATGREDYGAAYRFLRRVQRPFFAVGWWIKQHCARIETKRELDAWNRALESK